MSSIEKCSWWKFSGWKCATSICALNIRSNILLPCMFESSQCCSADIRKVERKQKWKPWVDSTTKTICFDFWPQNRDKKKNFFVPFYNSPPNLAITAATAFPKCSPFSGMHTQGQPTRPQSFWRAGRMWRTRWKGTIFRHIHLLLGSVPTSCWRKRRRRQRRVIAKRRFGIAMTCGGLEDGSLASLSSHILHICFGNIVMSHTIWGYWAHWGATSKAMGTSSTFIDFN